MKITYKGHTLDWQTADMLDIVQRRCKGTIYVMQGSYNTGVSASAGTHNGAGAVDAWPVNFEPYKFVLESRRVGFATWHRLPSQGPWHEHCHGIVLDLPGVSSGALTQEREYRGDQNGLANHHKDDGPRFNPIPTWASYCKSHPRALAVSWTVLRNQYNNQGKKDKLDVRRLQRCIKYVGGVDVVEDGHFGPGTAAALKQYQKKVGLGKKIQTGKPNRQSLNKLFNGHYKLVVV